MYTEVSPAPHRVRGFPTDTRKFRNAYATPNLCTNIMDFRGFDSSTILNLRGGIPRPIGNFPESLSQAILVGIILVGKSGVRNSWTQNSTLGEAVRQREEVDRDREEIDR